MKRWMKALIGMAALAAVVSGIVVGTALAQGGDDGPGEKLLTRVAQKLGISVDELKQAFTDSELELVDEAVAEGRLSACQGDRIKERVQAGRHLVMLRPSAHRALGGQAGAHPGARAHGPGRVLRGVVHATADFLDIDPPALKDELREGQSIAQVAEGRGVSRADLTAGILAEIEEHLSQAVEEGRIPQERADEALQKLTEKIDGIIDLSRCPPPASSRT